MVGLPEENGQPIIFEILKPENVGIELNPRFVMIPWKTISILIVMEKEAENLGDPSDFCSQKLIC